MRTNHMFLSSEAGDLGKMAAGGTEGIGSKFSSANVFIQFTPNY